MEKYNGTRSRSGHFCPYRSMNAPRAPAVSDPAIEFKPIANPAIAMECVDCCALKNIESPTVP